MLRNLFKRGVARLDVEEVNHDKLHGNPHIIDDVVLPVDVIEGDGIDVLVAVIWLACLAGLVRMLSCRGSQGLHRRHRHHRHAREGKRLTRTVQYQPSGTSMSYPSLGWSKGGSPRSNRRAILTTPYCRTRSTGRSSQPQRLQRPCFC